MTHLSSRRQLALVTALACAWMSLPSASSGQTVVAIQAPASSPAARALRQVLASRHRVIVQRDSASLTLQRDTVYRTSLVVVGGTVHVASLVLGDVVVVGGDLFVEPGGVIEGRGIAIGGGSYPSMLGRTRDGLSSFRDETLIRDRTVHGDTILLVHRRLGPRQAGPVQLPFFGVRIPSYDRVNGVSLGWGPSVSIDSARIEADPRIVYRSNLGAIDPIVLARMRVSPALALQAEVGRMTLTNDGWIRSTLINSLSTLVGGTDTRNYYRSDRAELRAVTLRRWATGEISPYAGVRTERDWSTGPSALTTRRPWSIGGRGNREEGMLRPNPMVARGNLSSAIAGFTSLWESGGVRAKLDLDGEGAFAAPTDNFVQLTTDLEIGFPTFGAQSVSFQLRNVATTSTVTPPQRYAYLGGSGTLSTMTLLSMGGDHLLYTDSRYYIPIQRIALPLVGSPTIMLRHAMGSAGVGGLPKYVQNVGVRVMVAMLQAEIMYDPASKEKKVGFGVTLGR